MTFDSLCGGRNLLTRTVPLIATIDLSHNLITLLAQANQHSLSRYLRSHYGDRTFEHLYRWNWFDTALLIPYFLVMIILAFIHSLWRRKNRPDKITVVLRRVAPENRRV